MRIKNRKKIMIYYTDNRFDKFIENPYNNNCPYDDSWVLLQLIDKADFISFTGNNGNGIFRLILTKQVEEWKYSIMDFIEYETIYNKNIIAAIHSDDLKAAKEQYLGHCYKDNFLRKYETSVLVHTTTPEAYRQIIKDGSLKSWNRIHQQNLENVQPIGAALGDPPDYSDYIMFNQGGVSSEIVIASKEKGYIDMDIHSLYTPGARFYFDAEKIAKDGLLVRDGAHLKVKDILEIKKYLIWTSTPDILGLPQKTTPFEFGTQSDKMFQNKFGIIL